MGALLNAMLVANYKTTIAGAALIGIGALNTFFGIQIPGAEAITFAAALPGGIGLIVAQDASAQIGGLIGGVLGASQTKK